MKSIGEFNERSLHRSLKERYAVVGSATEQAIEGFVVDAVNGDHIVEVQTGSFWPLRNKLQRLLNAYSVTLVHPVAREPVHRQCGGGQDHAGDTAQVAAARLGV